jgi:phage baseplate assembly protein W
MKKYYKGFSTRGYERSGRLFDIYNVECVEEDLLNEIFTVRGERIGMPTFGTRIPLLTFELADTVTMDAIREDLRIVCSHDPRVELLGLNVIPVPDKNALVAIMKIRYIEFNITRDLNIEVTSK